MFGSNENTLDFSRTLEFWIYKSKVQNLDQWMLAQETKKSPSWCLLWSYWHANVALQSIPPLPWFCRDSSQHEAFESNFWAMAEINNWKRYKLPPHKNLSRLANPLQVACVVHLALHEPKTPHPTPRGDTLSFETRKRSEGRWGSQSLASDPGQTGRFQFSSLQRFFCMQHIHKKTPHGICIYVIHRMTVWCTILYTSKRLQFQEGPNFKGYKTHYRWPRQIPGRCQPKKKRPWICLLRVPGTHLFSIWGFKALKNQIFCQIKRKIIRVPGGLPTSFPFC